MSAQAGTSIQNATPIKMLSPYVKWRICGLVTDKSEVRNLVTQRGPLKVFNFEVTDAEGECIRVNAFNEAADKFSSTVNSGSMYYISNGTVRAARKDYNNTNHAYEITLRNESEVTPCTDRNMITEPKLSLRVIPLSQISTHVKGCVDVLAVVDKIHEMQSVTLRTTGDRLQKRDLELVDLSGAMAVLTLWGSQAESFSPELEHQPIGVKGASVREFNGAYSLSALKTTKIQSDLAFSEAEKLLTWYTEKRPNLQMASVSRMGSTTSQWRIIDVVNDEVMRKSAEKGMSFVVVANIIATRPDSALYKSCGTGGCKKKVVESSGGYRCEKCNLTLSSYKYVLLLSVQISDFSGSYWITAFGDQAAKLLGKSAEELGALQDSGKVEEYEKVFRAVQFHQYRFGIYAKKESYNDNERVRWRANSIDAVDIDEYLRELRKAVEVLEKINL